MKNAVQTLTNSLRNLADSQERNNLYDLRNVATDTLRAYADKIDDAIRDNGNLRNCDRGFQNAKEAEKVFWQERKAFMDSMPTSEEQLKAIKNYPAFADWLLLPVNDCHQKPYPPKS